MPDMSPADIPFMEWEFLKRQFDFPEITEKGELPDGVESIKASRAEDYRIKLEIRGTSDKLGQMDLSAKTLGATVSPFSIAAKDEIHSVVASGVFNGNKTWNFGGPFEMVNSCRELHIEYPAQPIKHTVLYFLNAPALSSTMLRGTRRKTEKIYTRERGPEKLEKSLSTQRQSCSDYFQVEINDGKFNFCQTPKEYVPDWSRCCTMEFEDSKHSLGQLQEITEALSFVLGKHLLKIGGTDFSENWEPIRAYACVPHSSNLKAECAHPEMPPVKVDQSAMLDEKLVGDLTGRYLKKYQDYNLHRTMLLFWSAQTMPLETQMVKFHAALSSLLNSWFASTKTKSKGKYLSDSDYKAFLGPIEAQVNAIPEKKIINKILRANNMGENEKMDAFFDEIGLPIGEVEKSALYLRNRFAHGHICQENEVEGLVNACRAYQTLINRVILKLLEYDGHYIDYSTLDFPTRHINSALGGADGTGKAITL